MNKKYLGLTILGVGVIAGVLWFASLDKETRGLLGALPTDRDVLSWKQEQREAAFRAMDRIPLLAKASTMTPSPTPLALPAGPSLDIPGIDAYMTEQNTAGLVILQDGKVRFERYGLGFDAAGRWTSFSVAKSFTSTSSAPPSRTATSAVSRTRSVSTSRICAARLTTRSRFANC